ncbi:hypothetical protein [Corallococcus carmarthensis]|uniref:Lipoprotein n=1 Tax=Corallococcus carmarthensis TaxID=2316728 RepID=A0A3A8KSL7_9BACT|nr:hypothetical protein [Corallococcus carmarthensis]NOK16494.1 hypothetical protein [Corallococcus carmarthensis]RKH07205.1 hypothetical protein D7X32_02315 [Corallococcus carmarthensis]
MHPLRWSLQAVLLGSLCACGGDPASPVVSPEDPPLSQQMDPVLADQIEAVRQAVLADRCFREQPDVSVCNWGDFAYNPSQFAMSQNTGEAILVIDDFPTLPPRAIRYKNRIKGYFRVNGQGQVGAVPFSWRAPVTLFQGLSTFATPDFHPAEQLRALREPLASTYGFYDVAGNSGHGSYVLSLLVEANPHQPLVLLDTLSFHGFALEDFCDASGSQASQDRLRARASTVASQLRGLMAAQGVRFVNLSAGMTLEAVRQEWTSYCAGPRPDDNVLRGKLNAYRPIYDALFHTPGVFASQAAISAPSPQDNPFDFPSADFPNRLLVGYFTLLESGLGPDGRGPYSLISGWPERANVDIYVNTGVLTYRPFDYNKTPLLQVDGFGVDIQPITRATTSWVAPLALSRFVNARYAHFNGIEMSDALIPLVMRRMMPVLCDDLPGRSCMYQDPLLYGQVEAVRLNYRPREYVAP